MGISKNEVNLRRLLASAPQQQNQAKLVHVSGTIYNYIANNDVSMPLVCIYLFFHFLNYHPFGFDPPGYFHDMEWYFAIGKSGHGFSTFCLIPSWCDEKCRPHYEGKYISI